MTDTCTSGDKTQKFGTDYYDNDSAPIAKNINTEPSCNQNQKGNLNYCQSETTPETPYYESASPININDNMNNKSNLQLKYFSKRQILKQYILAWILVGVSLIDILFQFIFWFINIFSMIDDISILAISSVYIIYFLKEKNIMYYMLF